VPDLDGLEFATASFVTQSFPRHFHEKPGEPNEPLS
jgi:hypothetical protein